MKFKRWVFYAVVISIIGFAAIKYREFDLKVRIRKGDIVAAKTLRYIRIGRNTGVEYIYIYKDMQYFANRTLVSFTKNNPEVPGKYFVIVSKTDPTYHLLIQNFEADTLLLNKIYTDVSFDNEVIKMNLSRGGKRAKMVP